MSITLKAMFVNALMQAKIIAKIKKLIIVPKSFLQHIWSSKNIKCKKIGLNVEFNM